MSLNIMVVVCGKLMLWQASLKTAFAVFVSHPNEQHRKGAVYLDTLQGSVSSTVSHNIYIYIYIYI